MTEAKHENHIRMMFDLLLYAMVLSGLLAEAEKRNKINKIT